MRTGFLILCFLATVVLFGSGCAYFRPSQTEAERLQEQQSIRQDEYLKGSLLDGIVQAAGSFLSGH